MKATNNTVKKVVGKIHLWLGLTSGLVVFIVAVTGCIYAFQSEIQDITQPYRFVPKVGATSLPPSQLKALAQKLHPDKDIRRIYQLTPDRSVMVLLYGEGYYYTVFVDQYTGAILENKDMYTDFFTIVLELHMHLLLPGEAGELVVPIATLIFVAMLVTGIVLWWPRNKAAMGQRFRIKWSARWRRKNYDLHNVLGFYATWVVILIALTGLVWGFKWFEQSVYWVASGGEQLPERPTIQSDTTATALHAQPMDVALTRLQQEYPKGSMFLMLTPIADRDPLTILVNNSLDRFGEMEYRYFDQKTLREYPAPERLGKYEEASVANKILKLNYDIHTGSIAGLPGKIIVFLASLIAASLPVSGFMIWWGRRAKKTPRTTGELPLPMPEKPVYSTPREQVEA